MTARPRLRRACAALVLALVLLVVLVVLLARRAPPDFARLATPAGPAERRLPLPVLMQLDGDHPVACVFVDASSPAVVRYTVVWSGESHPWPLVDRAYDVYRACRWGRVMDVETFSVVLAPDGSPRELDLAEVAAGDQTWSVPFPEHRGGAIPWSDLERRGGRPVLWIATWNHMLARSDLNPGLSQVALLDYPVYRGSREEVEAIFGAQRR